ncbi:hypothetical protein F5887DRAFT_957004 [Amanita rubescens]|nr:hypothetical protein F5887DRAFT_957004 [Amanita rubescens]
MHPIIFIARSLVVCTFFALQTDAYFSFSQPNPSTKWQNNGLNQISWTQGKLDGVNSFDIEFTRISVAGNWPVAKGVSHTQTSLNIMVENLPSGDDYFVLFLNTTGGIVYAVSPRFTVLAPSNSSASTPKSNGSPTITVSSTPNPTQQFATTFPAGISTSRALPMINRDRWHMQAAAVGTAVVTSFIGVLWTLLL